MRVMIKGGVWKNTEDEILKAAVRLPAASCPRVCPGFANQRGVLKRKP
jgi:hypothetical protein